jgi:hypothetical protein
MYTGDIHNLYILGHFPSAGIAGTERKTGCDPKTTSGAGYGADRRIL